MNKKIFIFSILSFLTLSISSQQSPDISFLFPLDISPSVSGTFAELRTNHFHSGLDLSTNGKTGLPVKSTEKGFVSRIKVSPVGYGNAIYVTHPNGYTTVYGHLSRYAPKIDSIITREQYKNESFAIDYFPSKEISINKGEIIGYSGNSGSSGGPHLHYEVRDTKTEEPINPYFFQSIIKDDIRPKMLTIRLYPLNAKSTIDGQTEAKNIPIVFYDGKYHLKGNPKIYATGEVGIGIEMLDYLSGSWKKCGVNECQMSVNNQKWFGWELNRFSFSESRYINSHIDYAYKMRYGKRFQRCFRLPNNKLRIYKNVQNEGIIIMDSIKNISILAMDVSGNKAELDFKLFKGNTPTADLFAHKDSTHLLAYNKEYKLVYEDITCTIPKGSFYEDTEFIIKKEKNINNKTIYSIGDESIPLQSNVTIKIPIPQSLKPYGDKVTLAHVNSLHKFSYAGGEIDNNKIALNTRSLGKFTFYIDSIPPSIQPINFIKNKTYYHNSHITFKISDDFSDIKSYQAYINNQWVLFEYDAKSNTLSCPLNKLPNSIKGSCNLKMVIIDNCNNKTLYQTNFFLK